MLQAQRNRPDRNMDSTRTGPSGRMVAGYAAQCGRYGKFGKYVHLGPRKLKREGDKLILTGKSVGNGINIAFTDTLTIDRKSTDDSLFLRQGTNVQAFGRLRR